MRKYWRCLMIVSVLFFLHQSGLSETRSSLRPLEGAQVPSFSLAVPEEVASLTLLRSTSNLAFQKDQQVYPIARIELPPQTREFQDTLAPQQVELHYQLELKLKNGDKMWSNVERARCAAQPIKMLAKPQILVDKVTYCLMLMDGPVIVRRFPIALGADPNKRKLHFDRASTPEGVYRITGLQPRATYHRAYDLNYPNSVDQTRYRLSAELGILPRTAPPIGGEIQVHGGGIEQNWTWGCIALRNQDMDWLFARPELKAGCRISIAGSELRPEDLHVITAAGVEEKRAFYQRLTSLGLAEGDQWGNAIGRFQYHSGLPITTQLDRKTRERLKLQTALSKASR